MTAPYPADPSRTWPQDVRLARPRSTETSTTGAKVLVVIGALLLIGSLALTVVVVRTFVGLLPLDVLAADGGPGPSVLASASAPGELEVELEAGTRYALFLAQDEPTGHTGLDGSLVVTGPGGDPVDLRTPGVTASTSRGGVSAHTVAAFTTTSAGTYTVAVPAMLDGSDSSVLLAPDSETGPFVAGVLGTVFGVFAILVLVPLGIAGVVGGGLWWRSRRRTARAAAPAGSGPGATTPPPAPPG